MLLKRLAALPLALLLVAGSSFGAAAQSSGGANGQAAVAAIVPYTVAVVPGHGGDDPGAVYPPNSRQPELREKDFTLPIALKLRDLLAAEDVRVVMTRTSDITTTGEERAQIAERAHADIFVALHVNSFYSDPSVRGVEAQFFSDPRLADVVGDGLVLALRQYKEPVRTSKDREQDNILSMPGVIVEAGYLSNATDRQLLAGGDFQDSVARGAYDGILKYAPQIEALKPRIEAQKAIQAQSAGQLSSRQIPWLALAVIMTVLLLGFRMKVRAQRRNRAARYEPAVRYR